MKPVYLGLAAFVVTMLGMGYLVHEGKLQAEIMTAPVAAFVAWLFRSPLEEKKPDA